MKKRGITLFFLVFLQLGFSQVNKSWKGYFSYNEIKDISQDTDRLFVASENALFYRNISGTIKTINTIDGLSGQTISAVYHSAALKKTVVGYENGLMTVINEIDGSMVNVVDIINKSLPANLKKINHFMEYEGILYVSCNFGIVQYNLKSLNFGDTYFIGDIGSQIAVSQTAIFEGKIYAATFNNGVRWATITNPNLNDYNQWTTINGGWNGIESFGTTLFATSTDGKLQRLEGNSFVSISNYPAGQVAVDIRNIGLFIIVSTKQQVLIYDSESILKEVIKIEDLPATNSEFTCATLMGDTVFLGTKENGLFSKQWGSSTIEKTTPDGPSRNAVFAINATTKNLWAVYGGYDINYNPYSYYGNTPAKFPISKYDSKSGWIEFPYETLLGAKALSKITINLSDENQVFVSSYYSGLLKLGKKGNSDLFEVATLYNATNTGSDGLKSIQGEVPDDIRVNGAAFDKMGNLWSNSSLVKKGLKVLKTTGEWQSFNMESVKTSGVFFFGRLLVDKNGTKWMATLNDGIIGFNETPNTLFKTIRESADNGNLPINDVRAIAIDTRNQMWIGTRKGLRVLSSVDSFLSPDPLTTEPIIVIEENLAQELLYEQSITDIVVDGANNKWIGTSDSGIFLVSSNGQKTIYHFTIDNSPLPSNNINDIDINGISGEVFIATTKGLVSFKGTSTLANENLNAVFVYPNPVRPEFLGSVKISGLIDKATVKIADIEGNLVYETTSEGGTIEWDTTAFGKYKVASGVYMIFISAQDGVETKVKKVMIIR